MTFLQIKIFNKKGKKGNGGQIRHLLSLTDLKLLFPSLKGSGKTVERAWALRPYRPGFEYWLHHLPAL